jgi:hypothetical protein
VQAQAQVGGIDSYLHHVKTVTGSGPVYEPTIKFYIPADEFLMSQAVKTATLEEFVKARALSSLPMNKAEIEFVLNRTADDCPMRELVIDTFSRDFLGNQDRGRDWLVSCLKDASFEQIVELVMAIKSAADFW